MVRSFACIALAILPRTAFAEGPAPPDPAGADALRAELPLMGPRLLLSWPIEPKRVSFSLGQPVVHADGTLQPYRLEALWFERGPLELGSFQRVEQSAQLDCRLTCQPVLERSLGFEARLQLGGTRALPENHVYATSAAILSALGVEQRQSFGFGGLLDF